MNFFFWLSADEARPWFHRRVPNYGIWILFCLVPTSRWQHTYIHAEWSWAIWLGTDEAKVTPWSTFSIYSQHGDILSWSGFGETKPPILFYAPYIVYGRWQADDLMMTKKTQLNRRCSVDLLYRRNSTDVINRTHLISPGNQWTTQSPWVGPLLKHQRRRHMKTSCRVMYSWIL